jgi:hypothetical protein
LAWFQAHSAFLGVGFTTRESEVVVDHPVRRRIVWWMMIFGNAGLIAAVSSLIPVFIASGQGLMGFWARLLWLASGLTLLWVISSSKTVDKLIYHATAWALRTWTRLEIHDYPSLLQLSAGYSVAEFEVLPGDWVAGRPLKELRLPDEGVQILGIRRPEGEYIGAPSPNTYIRRGDTLIAYGMAEHLAELRGRRADSVGEASHVQRIKARHSIIKEYEKTQRVSQRATDLPPEAAESRGA